MAASPPDLSAECVRDVINGASCRACADACPTSALSLNEQDEIELAAEYCTGCAACAGVCPTGAVSLEGFYPLPPARPGMAASVRVVCPVRDTKGALCLQALGLAALAGLWLEGVRRMELDIGDCSACANGSTLRFQERLDRLNVLLADRGLARLTVGAIRPGERSPQFDPTDRPDPRRRALLRSILSSDKPRYALQVLQSSGKLGQNERFAYSPAIDANRCNGCCACVRICPTGAMILINAGSSGAAYIADPVSCTGCGLCMDICEEKAIAVNECVPASPSVALRAFECRGCGAPSVIPQSAEHDHDLCHICARGGHFRKLHQVLD